MSKRKENEQWLSFLEARFTTPENLLKVMSVTLAREELDSLSTSVKALSAVLARQAILEKAGVDSATKAYALMWDLSLSIFGRVRYPNKITEACWEVFEALCVFFNSPTPARENMQAIIDLDDQLVFENIEEIWSLSVSYAPISGYAKAYEVLEKILERATLEATLHEQESGAD